MGRPWASHESFFVSFSSWKLLGVNFGTVLVCVPQLKRKVRDISFMTQHNSGQLKLLNSRKTTKQTSVIEWTAMLPNQVFLFRQLSLISFSGLWNFDELQMFNTPQWNNLVPFSEDSLSWTFIDCLVSSRFANFSEIGKWKILLLPYWWLAIFISFQVFADKSIQLIETLTRVVSQPETQRNYSSSIRIKQQLIKAGNRIYLSFLWTESLFYVRNLNVWYVLNNSEFPHKSTLQIKENSKTILWVPTFGGEICFW